MYLITKHYSFIKHGMKTNLQSCLYERKASTWLMTSRGRKSRAEDPRTRRGHTSEEMIHHAPFINDDNSILDFKNISNGLNC